MEGLYQRPDHEHCTFAHRSGTVQFSDDHDNLIVEELPEGENGYPNDSNILRPDVYEDAESSLASEDGNQGREFHGITQHNETIIEDFQALRCDGENEELIRERERCAGLENKRWSAHIFKRSHSQSISSDIIKGSEELLDAGSARRLRRRVRGPGGRLSVRFEGAAPESEAEYEESIDSAVIELPPMDSDVEDCTSTEAISMDTTEDAMDID
ncbi:MAG: hypothetical protein M1830_009436 [Pleopsidium flavum]|nr:MAG: hypothetical protein M1830_009436 [Pleopsidium flavum]